jgi:type I restriction-modification system DNA methylase subunit
MSQATISGGYYNSNLFSGTYLNAGVQSLDAWDCDEEAQVSFETLRQLWEDEGDTVAAYKEDQLRDYWIQPVLEVLGFETLPETALPDGGGFVDRLLLGSTDDRRDAAMLQGQGNLGAMYSRGLGVLEAKQWDADFESNFSEDRQYRNASHQIKYYLEKTPSDIKWGVLTDGKTWRLYGTKDYETETYYEVDLPELLERGSLEDFKRFYVFFRAEAFRQRAAGTFLEQVWLESETAAKELGEDLQDQVFTALRVLGRGLLESNDLNIDTADDEAREELKEQSLVLLYRLMFILYAESRGLIHPDSERAQRQYEENFSLETLRDEIFDAVEIGERFGEEFSEYSTTMWSRLNDLFRLIDEGNDDLGVPPYNGGLFDAEEHTFLAENKVHDRYLAEVIYRVSTTVDDNGDTVRADYGDLDTRHLGSIYEGLLEHQFNIAPGQMAAVNEDGAQTWKPVSEVSVADAVETVEKGELYVVNDNGERKATGAYYTPDYVVTYIIEETVNPLLEDIRDGLESEGYERGTAGFVTEFAPRVQKLKILDPAMGSGHFLTKATGYLTEQILAEAREAEVGTMLDESRIRREIAKECIYGVDLNEMAVELAKLSMWLETLAADQPLAFLDHHLKAGNSIVGSDIEDIEGLDSDTNGDESQSSLAEFGATREGTIERLMEIYGEFLAIENEGLSDVKQMERKYAQIQEDDLRRRLVSMANVRTAESFGIDVSTEGDRNPYEWMASALESEEEWALVENQEWFRSAQVMAANRDFFHWKLEYPEVFYSSKGEILPDAGFDAVIGNPPYISNWNLTEADEDLIPAIEAMFPDATKGHWDIYVPFCQQGINLLKEDGYHSFIISNAIATEKYSTNIRKKIIENHTLQQIVDLGKNVFDGVSRKVLIYTVKKTPPENHQISIVNSISGEIGRVGTLPQAQIREFSDYSWRTDLTTEDLQLRQRLESDSIQLGELCWVNPGVVAHSGSHSSLDFDKDDTITTTPTEGAERYVSGRDISRHMISWDGKYMEYEKYQPHFHRPKSPVLFESEKIIFSGISAGNNRIKSCYDDTGYYTNHSANHATMWTKDTIEYRGPSDREPIDNTGAFDLVAVAGIVNSKLLSYYFSKFLATKTLGDGKTGMYPENIRKLPIFDARQKASNPDIERLLDKLSEKTEKIIAQSKMRSEINLHFPDYITSYEDGKTLSDLSQPPAGLSNTLLTNSLSETERYEKMRIGSVETLREGSKMVLSVVPYVKPVESIREDFDTNSHGYTTLDPIPAMEFRDIEYELMDLIESFVPYAVDEAGGFAGFRDNATATITLLSRLESLTLPALDDVRDGLASYREAVAEAEELEENIQKTDDLIDQIVYDLYDLSDEEIAIVEESIEG